MAWDYWDRAIKVQAMILMTLLVMRSRNFHLEALIWIMAVSFGIYGVEGWLVDAVLTGGVYRDT